MSDEPLRSDEPKAPENESGQDADGVDRWVPTWVLGLVPLVVAALMVVLSMHI